MLAALLVALAPAPAEAITAARDLAPEEFPAVGAIMIRRADPSCGHEVLCAGTLIAADKVLTAAHCGVFFGEDGEPAPTYYFSLDVALEGLDAGAYASCPAPTTAASLLPITPGGEHPDFAIFPDDPAADFDALLGWHDVAVWTLDAPVVDVEPAAILDEPALFDAAAASGELVMVGYGPDLVSGPRRRAAVTAIAEESALELRYEGEAERCKGDSGGPTFLRSPTLDGPALVSVTSRIYMLQIDVSPCGSVIETRVDAYAEFIRGRVPDVRGVGVAAPEVAEGEGAGGCRTAGEPREIGLAFALLGLLGARRRRAATTTGCADPAIAP